MNIKRIAAFATGLAMTAALAACGLKQNAAATMHLVKTEGMVSVDDAQGNAVQLMDNLGLFSGYALATQAASYGWISLDDTKVAKIDAKSQIDVVKENKLLELNVRSGGLFFNVTRPLDDSESMDIRTSTMIVGIRGTCGWVTQDTAALLEGTVSVTAGDQTVTVTAGEMAVVTQDGELTVEPFAVTGIPGFVMDELEQDEVLCQAILEQSGIDVLTPAAPLEMAMEQYRAVLARAQDYFEEEDHNGMVVTITWKYALAQMQTEYQIPALILERETFGDEWGDLCTAKVFQYNPDSGDVIEARDTLGEGASSAGGYRGVLTVSGDGNGILAMSWSGGTGAGTVRRATLVGDMLQFDTLFDGNDFDELMMEERFGAQPISWYDCGDLSGLGGWTPMVPSLPVETEQSPLTDGERTVLSGTVRLFTVGELTELGHYPEIPGEDLSNTIWLIALDEEQTVGGILASDPTYFYEGTTWAIAPETDVSVYDGQHIVFSIDPAGTMWSGDVLGLPFTADIHVLSEG